MKYNFMFARSPSVSLILFCVVFQWRITLIVSGSKLAILLDFFVFEDWMVSLLFTSTSVLLKLIVPSWKSISSHAKANIRKSAIVRTPLLPFVASFKYSKKYFNSSFVKNSSNSSFSTPFFWGIMILYKIKKQGRPAFWMYYLSQAQLSLSLSILPW